MAGRIGEAEFLEVIHCLGPEDLHDLPESPPPPPVGLEAHHPVVQQQRRQVLGMVRRIHRQPVDRVGVDRRIPLGRNVRCLGL